jgi:hypothetical protein
LRVAGRGRGWGECASTSEVFIALLEQVKTLLYSHMHVARRPPPIADAEHRRSPLLRTAAEGRLCPPRHSLREREGGEKTGASRADSIQLSNSPMRITRHASSLRVHLGHGANR